MELIWNKAETIKMGDVEKSEGRGWWSSVYEYYGTHEDEFKIVVEAWWPSKTKAVAHVKKTFKEYNTVIK